MKETLRENLSQRGAHGVFPGGGTVQSGSATISTGPGETVHQSTTLAATSIFPAVSATPTTLSRSTAAASRSSFSPATLLIPTCSTPPADATTRTNRTTPKRTTCRPPKAPSTTTKSPGPQYPIPFIQAPATRNSRSREAAPSMIDSGRHF